MDMVVFIFILLALLVVLYYLLYQRHLRKALTDPAAARHSNLPAPENTVAAAAVLVLWLSLGGISGSLNSISGSISKIGSTGADSTDIDLTDVAEAISEAEEMHQDQQSILAVFWQEWDGDMVTLTVVPKTVNDKTTVTVKLGKSSATLQRGESAEFSGTLVTNKGEKCDEGGFIISVETDGFIYSEWSENNEYVNEDDDE